MAVTQQSPTLDILGNHLRQCGYRGPLLVRDCRFEVGGRVRDVPVAGFAHEPTDARSACIAGIVCQENPAATVSTYRDFGAAVVFALYRDKLQCWRQGGDRPTLLKTLGSSEISSFFEQHCRDLHPEAVFRAKTRGRFDAGYQISFVDAGLMPLVEAEIGAMLSDLMERTVIELKQNLGRPSVTPELGHWLFRSAFWLLAAKVLHDKQVPEFHSLNLLDVDDVLSRVSAHYGSTLKSPDRSRPVQREALRDAAATIDRFAHLGHITTESLATVYESTLISKETRAQLGIHSTPAYLVSYIVWQLASWIDEIDFQQRNVFEPACGHAAFLVSALRLLKELAPASIAAEARKRYLRDRLHGVDVDSFALEIARLSLTLADVPNPDGWDLKSVDMFLSQDLEHMTRQATILLVNPPFENFKEKEKVKITEFDLAVRHHNKTTEVLCRTIPHLRPGSVFGVVVPQGFLHNKDSAEIRSYIAKNFEISEICLFPDKVFTFSDMESAILIGRRCESGQGNRSIRYKHVRGPDIGAFRKTYAVTAERRIPAARISTSPNSQMRFPELEEIWDCCSTLRVLDDLAVVGKGLEYQGKQHLPAGGVTWLDHWFTEAFRGFVHLKRGLNIHEQPEEVWMNLDPAVIRRAGAGRRRGIPQVLVNYLRTSRGPWRLKALIDSEGHAVTANFLTARPREHTTSLFYLWALLNSPFANGFMFAHSSRRHNLKKDLKAMPVPKARPSEIATLGELAKSYFDAVRSTTPSAQQTPAALLLQLDGEILRLYELPPRLERQLLDLFAGWPRGGVPFEQMRYFPEDFRPCLPLYDYLSEESRRSTAGELRKRFRSVTDPTILAALRAAVTSYQD
ncbi:MAG: SAM-dependent DNA methyltransferase [bacterium]|nr:SAM-dependent DNA methyltransferase [bacterium]